MIEFREDLFFELCPVTSGNNGHLEDAEKITQECRHIVIKGRLALGECAIQIKNN